MEINEAINTAKQLKNHFRAFEKLEDFVNYAARMSGAVGDLEKKRDNLKAEIASLTDRWSHLTGQVEKFQEKAERLKREADEAEAHYNQVKGKILETLGN